jgi:hypothetical protein
MNTRIIGSIVLGGVLMAIQPAVTAGQMMEIGVAVPDGGHCMSYMPTKAETGTQAFRDAVSEAVGAAAAVRDHCPGAHVSITPSND